VTPTLLRTAVVWPVHPSGLDAWLASLPVPAASAIAMALESGSAAHSADGLKLEATAVADLSDVAAQALGLPPRSPFGLDIRLSGAMGKPGASLTVRWLQPGRTVPTRDASQSGLWLSVAGRQYRIASPMYGVLELVASFNAAPQDATEEQFRIWSRIRESLGETQVSGLTDGFLRGFRVVTASALTFSIGADAHGDLQIDPVLLTQRRAAEGEQFDHVRALTEADEQLFPRRLDQLRDGVPAFPISQGTYVVVDEPLQAALGAVKRLRQASPDQRKRAAKHPEAVIRELLGQDETSPSVFVETERFSERVKDVGEWEAPVLPWIKIAAQDWGAPVAGCGVRVNGVEVPIDRQSLDGIVKEMRTAVEAKSPSINIGGVPVPATQSNLAALEQLHRAVKARTEPESSVGQGDQEPVVSTTQVLIIETNFDQTSFNKVVVGSRPGRLGLPGNLRSTPKPHQEVGIQWLQRHWTSGSRGALLCDDMGLGKTYQALAFCQWLRELMDQGSVPRKPILIVAPVGLLRNWELESEEHLFAPGLGSLVRAYGTHLRDLRRGRHIEGTASLDTSRLAQADVVLANYEAVSDYQLSFGALPFCAVVFDEAQKIKSPHARMTSAAQGLNSDFFVAMTGTPVENRLADLWCIADTVQPGALPDLKEFSAKFESEAADVAPLRELVWQDEADALTGSPKLLLRRLKTDKLEGLPPKHEHVVRRPMPPRQHEAYARAVAMKEMMGPEGTLGMIHALRRISLHPILAEGGADGEELRPEDSARMAATIEILDGVSKAGEKALVFLESLDLQEADQLPLLLQRRYGLARLPMVINGEVSTETRQARVAQFQRGDGFDVMLLSPKAGGVGLTLTAANHVIHLSRWWNPAVEDQCSDRVYRIGQHKPVHIHYPLAILPGQEEASFDVQLQHLMERKRTLARNLLAAPAFTKQDYADLLRNTVG
jgi:hypothetical protein